MVLALNDVLCITENDVDYIKEFIFWFCKLCCESTSYGDLDFEIDWDSDETETEGNLRYFGVKNKEDAFKKSTLREIVIEEFNGRKATMYFYAPWEKEHGCEIGIINGVLDKFEK